MAETNRRSARLRRAIRVLRRSPNSAAACPTGTPSSRVAPISSASAALITPAATAAASTKSGCPHGRGGAAGCTPTTRRRTASSSRCRNANPAR